MAGEVRNVNSGQRAGSSSPRAVLCSLLQSRRAPRWHGRGEQERWLSLQERKAARLPPVRRVQLLQQSLSSLPKYPCGSRAGSFYLVSIALQGAGCSRRDGCVAADAWFFSSNVRRSPSSRDCAARHKRLLLVWLCWSSLFQPQTAREREETELEKERRAKLA